MKNVINENFEKNKIIIAFNPIKEIFEVSDATTQRNPEFINDISVLYKHEYRERSFINNFISNLRNSREVSADEEEIIDKNISALKINCKL